MLLCEVLAGVLSQPGTVPAPSMMLVRLLPPLLPGITVPPTQCQCLVGWVDRY